MPDWLASGMGDPENLLALAWRFGVDLLFTLVVVKVVYARLYDRRDYVFTYVLFNIITFGLCFLLRQVPIELGFALGLFAVFGILRYRTEAIRMRDLTYLFVVIGIAILNAVAASGVPVLELLIANTAIAGAVLIMELPPGGERVDEQRIAYDRFDLIRPEKRAELHADIEARTGLPVVRVRVEQIDLVREIASLTVYYQRTRGR